METGRKDMQRKTKLKYFAVFMSAFLLAAGGAFCSFADESTLPAPTGVTLEDDGTVSWDEPTGTGEYEVDKYEVELWRERNDEWREYRSKTVRDDTSCDFSFGYIARYKAKVKAIYIGGRESGWSEFSPIVNVSRDDVSNSGGGSYGGPPANWNRPYNPGPGVVGSGSTPPVANGGYGWVQNSDGRYWYKNYDGSYPANCWQSINGKWYYFDGEGYMATGWVWYNNSWYLCLPDGQMATGWRNVNDKWYYLSESGVMLTGYQQIDGKVYYLDSTGARLSNATSPDGHLFDANGVMIA